MRYFLRFVILMLAALFPVAGLAAAGISAFIEFDVIAALLGNSVLALTLVAVLETVKVSLITYLQFMREKIGAFLKLCFRLLQVLLLIISFSASCAMFAIVLDRPNLDVVRQAETDRVNARYDRLIGNVREEYAPDLEALRSNIEKEKQVRFRDGRYAGPRYRELDSLKTLVLARRDAKIDALERDRIEAIDAVYANDFSNDERAANETITPLLNLLSDVFGAGVRFSLAGLVMAAVLSLTLELMIIVVFSVFGKANADVLSFLHEKKKVEEGFAAARKGWPWNRQRQTHAYADDDRQPQPGQNNGATGEAKEPAS